MASVIRSDPDFRALPAELPPRVREVLGRCLEKDPKKRRRDIGDIRAELEAPHEPVSAETQERRGRPWLPVAGAVTLSLATGIAGWHLKPETPRPLKRFEMVLPEGEAFLETSRHIVAMSPQATHLVYVANDQFYLRALDQIEAVPIRGTEGGREPFFSLDAEWIGFFANGYLKKVAITGGTPVTLCEAENPYGASWTADGTIVFGQGSAGIWEVSANGGEPRVLVKGGGDWRYHGPQKLPNGKALLFTFKEGIASWDEATIAVEQLDTGERKTLIRGGSDARYLPTGHLIYVVESTVFAVPFDLGRLEVTGGPVPVVEGAMRSSGGATWGRPVQRFRRRHARVRLRNRALGSESALGGTRRPNESAHRQNGGLFEPSRLVEWQTPRRRGPRRDGNRFVGPRHRARHVHPADDRRRQPVPELVARRRVARLQLGLFQRARPVSHAFGLQQSSRACPGT